MFSPNLLEICMETGHAGAHLDGQQHGGRKPAETSVTEFCYKSANLSLEELKNVSKSLVRHVQAPSRKSLEIQA